MSAAGQTSRYAKRYQQNTSRKSQDRLGYNDKYPTKTSFLDKYRPKTALYYSASKDINNR